MRQRDQPSEADRAIAAYRAELCAEAELARGDLDEIEDHLRALITELRGAGLDDAQAIPEARRRLGDPRQLAREHARVRPAFGASLSRARGWSAALLLAPFLYTFLRVTFDRSGPGLGSMFGINAALGTAVWLGLVTGRSWARAILIGALSWRVGEDLAQLATSTLFTGTETARWGLPCMAGALAFVLPWRRRELTAAGITLALLAVAYHGTCALTNELVTRVDQLPFVNPLTGIAFVAVLVAGVGTLLVARWASGAAAVAALALAIACVELHTSTRILEIVEGALAAAGAAWVSTRLPARLGTLRSLAR